MKCPVDQSALVMSERQGIEIDYCPECRGVWLDRGELDKVIERSSPAAESAPQRPQPEYQAPRVDTRQYKEDHYRGHKDDYRHNGHHKKKKENFLGELFDF